jgi:23S rRNA (adenine-N6)-dimethyltransferase
VPGRPGRSAEPPRGQHFLRSAAVAERIVADAGVDGRDLVVELGAGYGVLTAALAARAGGVLAIELDPVCVRQLVRVAAGNVVVIHGDATAWTLPRSRCRVVANPPFAATSALLHRLLDDLGSGLTRADLVLQWQVARARAARGPCDLVAATWGPWWTFRRGRRLPARLFRPAPSVDAAVLVVERREHPLVDPRAWPAYRAFVRDAIARTPRVAEPVEGWVQRFRDTAPGQSHGSGGGSLSPRRARGIRRDGA